jgi:hypothetical protein
VVVNTPAKKRVRGVIVGSNAVLLVVYEIKGPVFSLVSQL